MGVLPDEISTCAFFIDGDNLTPEGIEEAFAHLKHGGKHVSMRRAYGGAEKLQGLRDVLRRHSTRAFLNVGKGTTDIALVVDVMDLLHGNALPPWVAIGSSDADFAPLAVRLRESGRRVICFAQKEKAAIEVLELVFDEVVIVDSPQGPNAEEKSTVTPARLSKAAVAPVVIKQAKAIPVKTNIQASKPVTQFELNATGGLAEVKAILKALPDWLPDTVRQLNQIGKPLREEKIAKGSKPLHELFRKHTEYFKVLPTTGAPKQVKLLKVPR